MFAQTKKARKNIMFLFRVKKKNTCKKIKFYLSYLAVMPSLKKNLLLNNKLSKKKKKKQTNYFLQRKKKYGDSVVLQTFLKKLYLNKLKKDNKNNTLYVQHFLNLFLQGGKGYFTEILYKNLLTIHKHNKIHFLLNLFKIIRYLQFFLLLKGYRYKVGRGVIKIRYFLTPVSILRQYFLSFFYFLVGVKKRADVRYYNKVFLEFFQLIFFDENYALETITHLYTLAQQSRMFVPKKKRFFLKRSSTVKKIIFMRSKLKFFLLNAGNFNMQSSIVNRYRFLQARMEQVYFLFCLRKRLVSKNKYKYNKQIKFLKNFKTLLKKKKMLLLLFQFTLKKFRLKFLKTILRK